jgi:hypothetical protein
VGARKRARARLKRYWEDIASSRGRQREFHTGELTPLRVEYVEQVLGATAQEYLDVCATPAEFLKIMRDVAIPTITADLSGDEWKALIESSLAAAGFVFSDVPGRSIRKEHFFFIGDTQPIEFVVSERLEEWEQQSREKHSNTASEETRAQSQSARKPGGTKRGPAADGHNHRKIVDIVNLHGAEWKSEIESICNKLDEEHLPTPKPWRRWDSKPHCWSHAVIDRRLAVIDAIQYRLNWNKRGALHETVQNPPAETLRKLS